VPAMFELVVGGIIVLALAIYLVVTLVAPERF
jgi:K+-transporting ATPase KdpF subunit